jgi:hypothetical protein
MATYSTMANFNINVRFFPSLCVVSLPFHVALGTFFVKADPAFELGFAGHVRKLRMIVDEAAVVRRDGDGRIGIWEQAIWVIWNVLLFGSYVVGKFFDLN